MSVGASRSTVVTCRSGGWNRITWQLEIGSSNVPQSVLDAIKMGIWDFEPEKHDSGDYTATHALPGTCEKLSVLSERVRQGLPLWHPEDRRTYDDNEPA
jgi:hypothetical protein